MRSLTGTLAILLLVAWPLAASAQAPAPAPAVGTEGAKGPEAGQAASPAGDAPAAKMKEWVKKGSQQKVVELTFDNVDRIEGKVQKPGVDYLITQGELKYEGLPLERDLLKDLEASLKGPPF